jgi:hypothetical protein
MATNPEPGSPRVRALEFPDEVELEGLGLTLAWLDAADFPAERIPAVIDLVRRAYNGGPVWFQLPVAPEEHLLWKLASPLGAAVTYIRDGAGQVVGFTGTVKRSWLIQGQRVVGQDGIDLALDPSWQQRGVPRAAQRARRGEGWQPGVEFGLGWATHPANRKIAIEQGRIAPGNPVHDYVRVLRPSWRRNRRTLRGPSRTAAQIISTERSRYQSALRTLRLFGGFIRSLAERRPHRPARGLTIRTADRFDELAAFLPKALSGFDFIQERTPEYLQWRYLDPRSGPFTVRVAEEGRTPLGYAITAVRDGEAYVADLLVLPEREDVAAAMLRDVVAVARQSGVDAVRIRLPGRHRYTAAVRRSGFFDLGARAGELLNPGPSDPAHFELFSEADLSVHLVYGDSDVV